VSQAYGCIAQKGGSSTVTPVMVKFLQYMGSMRRGRPYCSPSASHQAEPWPSIVPKPRMLLFSILTPPINAATLSLVYK
jgi:hypothetical protein